MTQQWRNVKDEFTIEDIGAPLLANLAKGIYTPEAMLREYVQNAGDAYFDLEEKLNKTLPTDQKAIDIYYPEEETIAVQDSGLGMELDDVRRFKRIALSSKLGKDRAGFRGIGIWAGFSSCSKLEVETTKLGDPNKYRLTLDFAEMRKSVSENINIKELLDERFAIKVADAESKEHYTQVKLVGINEEFADLLRPEELERIASEILPCRFNPKFKYAETISKRLNQIDGYQEFAIKVSDTEVFKAYSGNPEEPEFEILKKDDEEYAFVWYCKSSTMRSFSGAPSNFRLRVKNIAVGGPGMYSTEHGAHWGLTGTVASLASGELLDWYMGEIHITNADVRPNTPRSELELDSLSRKAISLIRGFYGDRIAFRRASSNVNSHKTQVFEISQQIDAGGTYQPDDAVRRLKTLKKYEQLSKTRSQSKETTTQDKVQKYERRILKSVEAKDTNLANKRRAVIAFLEGIAAASANSGSKKKANGSTKSRGAATTKSTSTEGRAGTATAQPAVLPDFEQILAEITQLIEKRLTDQDDLATELSEAIEEIFKEHGLLVIA
ncbi:MAG: hypothetical protein JWO13_405 [Acidobacteriales bacterium]|nr:hypothetical protein [Terriglobales bacterium]